MTSRSLDLERGRGASDGQALPLTTLRLLQLHVLGFGLVILPFLFVEIPALVDYPNHLARMQVLAQLAQSPDLQSLYSADWAPMSNLAMDLLVPILAPAIGLIAAGKLFVILAMASVAGGTLMLHYALHRRLSAWSLVVHLILFNYVLAFGFLNYLLAVGLMLSVLAVWILSENRPVWLRLLLATVGCLALFFCHVLALLACGICIAAYELQRAWQRPLGLLRSLATLVFAGLPFLPALLLQVTVSPAMPEDAFLRYDLSAKLRALLSPTLFYQDSLDVVLFLVLGFGLYLGFKKGFLEMAPSLRLALLGLTGTVALMPTWLLDNWGNDWRLFLPLAAVGLAAIRFVALPRKLGGPLLILGATLLVARVTTVTLDWQRYDTLFGEFRAAARELPAGARLLPAFRPDGPLDAVAPNRFGLLFFNTATLALLERPVFVPTLFTAKGRQILSVRPPNDALDVPHSSPVPPGVLAMAVDPDSREQLLRQRSPSEHFHRFAGWPQHFDYVVMLDFGAPLDLLPEILKPIKEGSFFTLYRIDRAGDADP